MTFPAALSGVGMFLEVELAGAPIATAMPPGLYRAGMFVRDKTPGAPVEFYWRGSDALGAPEWRPLPAGGGGIFPVLYLVDNRYAVPPTPNGPWPTLAAARAQLLADGYGPGVNGPATIQIVRGTYAESFTLDPGISLSSMGGSFVGATIEGTITVPDPTGAALEASLVGVTVSPLAGNALEFNGTALKGLYLYSVLLFPVAAGAVALNYTNTNPGSRIVAYTCEARAPLGSGIVGAPGATGLMVWWKGGVNGGGAGQFTIDSGGLGLVVADSTLGGAASRFGGQFSQLLDVHSFGVVEVFAGFGNLFDSLFAQSPDATPPLTVAAGAALSLLGTTRLACDGGNFVAIAGAGIIESVAPIQMLNGDSIDPLLVWNFGGTLGRLQPRLQQVFTADPPSNPYAIPGRFESCVVAAPLSGPWAFVGYAPNEVPDGHEFVFKNLDPNLTHTFDLPPGATVDQGLLPLPAPIPTRDYLRLRALRALNSWMEC